MNNTKSKIYTPLRYPGGKSKLTPLISDIIRRNSIVGHYFEPFAGGAGIAFNLLFNKLVSHIHLNDVDPAIYSFWFAAINDTDNLLKLIFDTPINMEQWSYWRDVMNCKIQTNLTEKGFATLFMNRTNRSGILKAGVIGGKNQSGLYKLGDRFNKIEIANRIQNIALHRAQISIYSEDALELLKSCNNFLPDSSLIYLDPPYYVKGQGLYRKFYNHQDHLDIANILKSPEFNKLWVISYDDVPEIHSIYKEFESYSYKLSYTAQKKYVGQEIMFFSKELIIPSF